MRLFAALCLFVGLCGFSVPLSAAPNAAADLWFLDIVEPAKDDKYTEPVVIIPRGTAWGDKNNNLQNFTVVVEFWHQNTGGKSVMVGSKTYAGKSGQFNDFNLGLSPQLKAGTGWVGIKIVDGETIIDWKIHNYTVAPAPVPVPVPVPPAAPEE